MLTDLLPLEHQQKNCQLAFQRAVALRIMTAVGGSMLHTDACGCGGDYSHRHFDLEVYIMVAVSVTVDATNALAGQPMTIVGLRAGGYLHS